MFRRLLLLSVAALLLQSHALAAYEPEIRSIDITAVLHRDGSASMTERWDVTVASGTEWYLSRTRLDGVGISDLRVVDENGLQFTDVGEWDIDRSLEEKAGKSGIHPAGEGVELCWGVGSYGPHIYTVTYKYTGLVASLSDCDLLHAQFVSPKLSSNPQRVRLEIKADFAQIDTTNSGTKAYGFIGDWQYTPDGSVVLSSSEPFRHDSQMIAFIAFDKGLFEPTVSRDMSYAEAAERADRGSDEDEDNPFTAIIATLLGIVLVFFLICLSDRRKQRKYLGMLTKEVNWSREIPFGGNLAESAYVGARLSQLQKQGGLAAALILRMINYGMLVPGKDSKDKITLAIGDVRPAADDRLASGFYDMLAEAAGENRVLENKEFSKWAKKHHKRIAAWVDSCDSEGKNALVKDGYFDFKGKVEPLKMQPEALKLVGLKKFLGDFTLVAERESIEVTLWKDYLVYAALFGIADKVAKQLKEIRPELFTEDDDNFYFYNMYYMLRIADRYSNVVTKTYENYHGGSSGSSSFGGGGGFSAGGVGGGSR